MQYGVVFIFIFSKPMKIYQELQYRCLQIECEQNLPHKTSKQLYSKWEKWEQ